MADDPAQAASPGPGGTGGDARPGAVGSIDERPALALFAVLGLVLAAYARVAMAGWVRDDLLLIRQNPMLNPPQIPRILLQDMWCCDPALRSAYFRPVFMLSLALDRRAFGDAATPAHLQSLALHLACVAALYTLLRRAVPSGAAALGALLLGLHPVVSEAVAWVSARSDLLAALFVLLALHAARALRPDADGPATPTGSPAVGARGGGRTLAAQVALGGCALLGSGSAGGSARRRP